MNFKNFVSINKSNHGTTVVSDNNEIPYNTESYDLFLEKINLIIK